MRRTNFKVLVIKGLPENDIDFLPPRLNTYKEYAGKYSLFSSRVNTLYSVYKMINLQMELEQYRFSTNLKSRVSFQSLRS